MKKIKISYSDIVNNALNELINDAIENNKKPIFSVYQIQKKIHKMYRFEKTPILSGKKIRQIIGINRSRKILKN